MMLSEKSKLQAEGLHGIWYHLYDILNAKYYVFSDLIYMVEESKTEGIRILEQRKYRQGNDERNNRISQNEGNESSD